MKIMFKTCIAALVSLSIMQSVFATENAFYILRNDSSERITPYAITLTDLTEHTKKIQLVIAQAYHIDQHGVVTGSIDQQTIDFAKAHNIKLMVLITNSLFDNKRAHQLLTDKTAEKKAIHSILDLCTTNHFYGVQFDFEGIKKENKDLLTAFFKEAADTLHQQGFKISFAVVPNVKESERTSQFLIRKDNNWSGVYDLKALGDFGDFITLMSYDQHSNGTTPGPFEGNPWAEATLQNTLQYVPADKVSLGVPTYSSHWKTSSDIKNIAAKISVHITAMPYKDIDPLIKKYNAKLQWDDNNKNYYAIFEHHFLNEYVFVEDESALKAKMKLINKYKLRGISLFDLGNEDPGIWNVIR